MVWPFGKKPNTFLGVDIGTSTVRIVELSRHGEQKKLENYGLFSIFSFFEKIQQSEEGRKKNRFLSSKELALVLTTILKEAKTRSFQSVFSLPDFSTFFTTFLLPPMSKEEIPQAVKFEARRHVPLPLSEVTLDWLIVAGDLTSRQKEELEVLLVVVLNETVNHYTKVAELCQLQLSALEAEVFGLFRSLIKDNKQTIGLVDIGARSTTCSIVDRNTLRASYSFDVAGNDFTERIANSLDLDYQTAELLKQKEGLLPGEKDIRKALLPLIDLVIDEIKRVSDNFYRQEGREIKAYILAGGSALLPGLKEHFSDSLGKEIKIADPFLDIVYPPILEDSLKEIGPGFSIAVGMAMKGLE